MATLDKFKCDACGKAYAWKPELAGKKVRCKCGGVVVVPKPVDPEPADEDNSLDDLYALTGDDRPKLADTIKCPACHTDAPAGSVICTNCGLNFQTGQRIGAAPVSAARPVLATAGAAAAPRSLGYAGRKPIADDKAANDSREEMKMMIAPAIMLLLGIGATFYYALVCLKLSVGDASVYVPVTTAINILMISIGLFLAMKMLDFSLGAPALALLKVGAIAMLPGAVDNIIDYYGGFMGGFIGWGVALVLYYILLMWFFDLDGMEVYIVTAIFWLTRTWLAFFVVAMLLSSMMNLGTTGGSGIASSAFGGGSKSVKTDFSQAGRINNRAENSLLISDTAEEAKEWIGKGDNFNILGMDHAQSVKFIDDLYDAGAEEVTAADVHKMADKMQADKFVVTLPEDPAARKKIFAIQEPIFKGREVEEKDLGKDMAYLILDFDGNDE